MCPECGYPLQKKKAQNIINENLDKITGAKSKSYVTFKDLFKNTFKKHTDEELDEVFICGGLSLILAILFFSLDFNTDINTYFGALMVGLIEEVAKAAIVALFLFKSKKSNYILNGLLVGAAVGAGFAAFETAGYILRFGLSN